MIAIGGGSSSRVNHTSRAVNKPPPPPRRDVSARAITCASTYVNAHYSRQQLAAYVEAALNCNAQNGLRLFDCDAQRSPHLEPARRKWAAVRVGGGGGGVRRCGRAMEHKLFRLFAHLRRWPFEAKARKGGKGRRGEDKRLAAARFPASVRGRSASARLPVRRLTAAGGRAPGSAPAQRFRPPRRHSPRRSLRRLSAGCGAAASGRRRRRLAAPNLRANLARH